MPEARERFRHLPEGQQIRSDSGADGIVRMKESKHRQYPALRAGVCACSPKGIIEKWQNPERPDK
jgi:hypothetical protein